MPKAAKKPTRRASAAQPPAARVIELPRFDLRDMTITLIGDSPLICHAWSEKAKKEMLAKQMKLAQEARAAKDPEQEFRDSLYPMEDGNGYGFPAVAFKAAAVDGCSHVEGITKVEARGAFHIRAGRELLRLNAPPPKVNTAATLVEPHRREDMVRIGMGTADIRYRGEFDPWSVNVPIIYNAGVLSAEQIMHLFRIAGFAIGVGEWRPQKDGSYGMFRVA